MPSGRSAGALHARERTRQRLGVHMAAAGACWLAGVPGIAGQRQREHAVAAVAQARSGAGDQRACDGAVGVDDQW
jgi:hypothetical protein